MNGASFFQVGLCLDIDEFCVDESHRRMGAATEMISFIKAYAKAKGFRRIELNVWEFNQGALAFYADKRCRGSPAFLVLVRSFIWDKTSPV